MLISFFVTLQNLVTERVQKTQDRGATAVEYGLLVALIAAVIVGTVFTLGGQINTAFQTVVARLPGAPAGG